MSELDEILKTNLEMTRTLNESIKALTEGLRILTAMVSALQVRVAAVEQTKTVEPILPRFWRKLIPWTAVNS